MSTSGSLSLARSRRLRALGRKKERDVTGLFLVEGLRLVREAVQSGCEIVEAYYSPDLVNHPGGDVLIRDLRRRCRATTEVQMREIERLAETVTPQGVLAVVRQVHQPVEKLLQSESSRSILVALDSVSDPGNAGTIIRTCDWFGIDGVILGSNAVELSNPKTVRATMGSIFHVPIAADVDLPAVLTRAKAMGYRIYTTHSTGEAHFDRIAYQPKSIIVFGNEAWGTSEPLKTLADYRVQIRRYGSAESLNVSVACGVILSCIHKLYDD